LLRKGGARSKPNNHLIPAANQIADPVDIPHARDYLVMIVLLERMPEPKSALLWQSHIDQLVSDIKSSYKKDIIEVDTIPFRVRSGRIANRIV